VAHQCERPACAEPAVVAYGFDPSRGVAWLEVFGATDPHHGRLCRRHAETMVVPKGWWLEDRRSADQLFAPPGADGTPERSRRNGRSQRPAVVIDLPLPPPAPVGDAAVGAVAAVDGASLPPPLPLVAVPAWTPTFVADDDLGGVLNATSPLLSRAFGRVKGSGTRARPPSA
jgi:Protein of unknown function (DUF3499)